MSESLLPPNSSALELAVSRTGAQLSALPVPARYVRDPKLCPGGLLPYLAWELSVDEWIAEWSEEVKRRVIGESVTIHRHKGTRGAVRRALAAVFGEEGFTLIEGAAAGHYDGSKAYNGLHYHTYGNYWARYSVLIKQPVSIQQAASLRRMLAWVAPARCHLQRLDFTQGINAYNGAIRYDNTFTHGVA